MKGLFKYFSITEWLIWLFSMLAVVLSYVLGDGGYPLTLLASLLGVTSLIFIAKGNIIGQFIIIVFSILYGIISIKFRYYGEMITYLFMSAPAAVFACVSWLKNPSKKGKREVKVATMSAMKWIYLTLFATAVTIAFYFILRYFDTENLLVSTLSVATSFFAAGLLFLRSPYYAIAYAANDVVLIILWTLACIETLSYLPMDLWWFAFRRFYATTCTGLSTGNVCSAAKKKTNNF